MRTVCFIELKYKAAILAFTGLLLFSLFQCANLKPDDDITILGNACAYLWDAQSADGGWHSETHGIMRSGESLTPFILDALLNVPNSIYVPSPQDIDNAMEFIRKNVQEKINIDSVPQILDYPNYTAAYALKTLSRSTHSADTLLVQYLTQYLVSQQFEEHRGIDTLHPAYGGWGFGEVGLKYGKVGHVDLSHTRRVLEALRRTLPAEHPAFLKAQRYLARVQNDASMTNANQPTYLDGGFFTSLVIPETNKSLPVPGIPDTWYSYATATCDGLLALRAIGVSWSDTRIIQAKTWLVQNQELRYPQGIPHDDPLQWHHALKYYHLAVRGEICAVATCDNIQRQKISTILISEQRDDGSFMNPMGAPNKEDDSLLATAFAITALTHAMY